MGSIMEMSGEKHNWRNVVLYVVSARFLDILALQTHEGGNADNRILLCIDGGIQAGKEGQCMQRRAGSAQCFALECVLSLRQNNMSSAGVNICC